MLWKNGQIPEGDLIIFNRGTTVHTLPNGQILVENWYQGLTPGTYQKHLALVALAKRNTGRDLKLAAGFSCYRPIYGQTIARTLFGNGAAKVSTSSHGGYWEGRETLAMDYANWASVYDGDRSRFYADCRAVGLTPGLISPARGYPDEPWHVIDLDPRRAVPAGVVASLFNPAREEASVEEDEMNVFMVTAEAVQGAGDSKGLNRWLVNPWEKSKRLISSEEETLYKAVGVRAIAGLQPKSYADIFRTV